MILLLPVLFVVMSNAALAHGFCDDNPPGNLSEGRLCRQDRITHVAPGIEYQSAIDGDPVDRTLAAGEPSGSNPAIKPRIMPDYSDLDMTVYPPAQNIPIEFDLDLSALNLTATTTDTFVDVLELGITSTAILPGVQPRNDRVLTMSVVRLVQGGQALEFAWRDEPAISSVVDSTSAGTVLASAIVNIGNVVHVSMVPVRYWSELDVTVTSEDQPLLPAFAASFSKPFGTSYPLRLRSGVLGGDLQRSGMETQYAFESPVITQ